MKKGLVMEGGAMRGLFTAGVNDVLLENNIEFDGAVGVSAGACFGCNYKSKQIGRVVRYNLKYCRDRRYCSLYSLITTKNLFGKDFCYREIPEKLDVFDNEAYESNPMEFYVVCTDVETGKAVYKKCEKATGRYLEWIRASASLPFVAEIVEIDGYKLLDGGMSDSVPLKFFENLGYDKNVVILTQPRGFRKEEGKKNPIIKRFLRKYPKMIEAIENRPKMYNDTLSYIEKREEEGKIIVLQPKEILPFKRTTKDREKLLAVYNAGREAATENLEKIKEFLEIK